MIKIYPVKNLAIQIKLVNQLKSLIPNLAYVIAAPYEGAYFHQITALIDSMNLRKYIHLLGFRPDIPLVLSSFDVFVLTSLTEGTSMALLEAMQTGLPVVVSNVGGNSHIISNGQNGFLFDLQDPDMLKEYIMELYKDPKLRRNIGDKAAETAKKYSVDHMALQYKNEYCRLCSK